MFDIKYKMIEKLFGSDLVFPYSYLCFENYQTTTMRIENDIKLDFKDVLIRPKRSTLASRSQVSVTRKLMFKHPPPSVCWEGTPICVANMDTTGTWAMASAVSKHKIQTCMHKHYGRATCKPFPFLITCLSRQAVEARRLTEQRWRQYLTPTRRSR